MDFESEITADADEVLIYLLPQPMFTLTICLYFVTFLVTARAVQYFLHHHRGIIDFHPFGAVCCLSATLLVYFCHQLACNGGSELRPPPCDIEVAGSIPSRVLDIY